MADGAERVERALRIHRLTEEVEAKLRKSMAKKGKLGLPPLLDARRLQYGIPDGAFRTHPTFDTVFVHQLAIQDGETYQPGGKVLMPETHIQAEINESPRGILVSAGLQAWDALRSNGIEIGHIVNLQRLSPYRLLVDIVAGVRFSLVMLHAGDIKASEDLARALRTGECKVKWDEESQQHLYVDKKGKQWKPQLPWMPSDY